MKGGTSMKISRFKAALCVAGALGILHTVQADEFVGPKQGVDWNDELTKDILGESRIAPLGGSIAELLERENIAASERLSRSGVKVLKRAKRLPNVPGVAFDEATAEYWQVVEVQNPDGSTVALGKLLSPEEVQELGLGAAGIAREVVTQQMSTMSDGLLLTGVAFRDGIRDSGFAELLGDESRTLNRLARGQGANECQWILNKDSSTLEDDGGTMEMVSMSMIGPDGKLYPMLYVMGPACMLASVAKEMEQIPNPGSPEAWAQAQAATRAATNKIAKLADDEMVGGHETKHIVVEGIAMKETMEDGSEVTINRMDVWLDPVYYVRRKIRMEGIIKKGRASKDFFMERENQDYRRVDDTYLYEPYKEVMRIGGIMSDKDRRELAKAKKELESAKQQLAQMPASQRAMMEGMFASQMAQLESLVDDGSATVEVITTDIEINPGFADSMITTFGGSGHSETLVRMIQTDLARLGFEPGPATGRINKATSDAISAYQASRNIAVNGAPSPELAAALQAEVGAL
tara:strand:- start:876 stop:2435 length:1560 start_codon:yes stop_codon:yes gene_type:complete